MKSVETLLVALLLLVALALPACSHVSAPPSDTLADGR
jgi:hypothetical protein